MIIYIKCKNIFNTSVIRYFAHGKECVQPKDSKGQTVADNLINSFITHFRIGLYHILYHIFLIFRNQITFSEHPLSCTSLARRKWAGEMAASHRKADLLEIIVVATSGSLGQLWWRFHPGTLSAKEQMAAAVGFHLEQSHSVAGWFSFCFVLGCVACMPNALTFLNIQCATKCFKINPELQLFCGL